MDDEKYLLELAARAAGDSHIKDRVEQPYAWNPIDDDGDAFRLAVHLHLMDERKWEAPVTKAIFDRCAGDWYAATRLAIVMAAAEIGRNVVTPNLEGNRPR